MNDPQMPENWRRIASTTDNSVRYDRAVHVPPSPQTRAWLRIDGITNDVALWFNDKYLGEIVTSFRAHYLELPQSVESATLSIEFLNRHRIAMPSVEIVRTGPIRITRHKVICTEATSERGAFDIHAEFDAQSTTDAWISCEIRGSDSEVVVSALRHHSLARGRNRLKWTEVLDQPLIWKPRGLSRGQTPLYTIHTSIGVEDEKSPSDFAEMFSAFRSITPSRRIIHINDESIPLRFATIDTPPWPDSDVCRVIQLTTVNKEIVYDEADVTGRLIVQQLPSDINEARQTVDALAHHPSIVAWSRSGSTNGHRHWRNRFSTRKDELARTIRRADPSRPLLS